MQEENSDAVARSHRVEGLCRELRQLVELSREQRRTIDELLTRLDGVMRRARRYRLSGAWRSVETSRG